MRAASKLVLATLAATALLALASSGASARAFSVTERNFEFIWSHLIENKTSLGFIDNVAKLTECNVTFLGSFVERTIAKTVGTKIAEIRHAERFLCEEGEAEFRGLNWNVVYRGFTGALPFITSVSIGLTNFSSRIRRTEIFNTECIATATVAEPAVFIIEEIMGGEVENIRADETARIRLSGMNPLCGTTHTELHLTGRGLVRNLPRTAKLTLTLI